MLKINFNAIDEDEGQFESDSNENENDSIDSDDLEADEIILKKIKK